MCVADNSYSCFDNMPMIYFSYKTDSLLRALHNKNIKIDTVKELLQKLPCRYNDADVFFEQLLTENINMENSDMILKMNERFKQYYDKYENIDFILINDSEDSVGRWQGFELMLAQKYNATIYLVHNKDIVTSLEKCLSDEKAFIDYKKMKSCICLSNNKRQ